MPRKNRTRPHTPYVPPNDSKNKKRYGTKLAADSAAQKTMIMNPNLTLSAYKGIDGGWYLTSK